MVIITNIHLTYEEHIKLGEILKSLGDDLVDLNVKIANRNGKTSKVSKIADSLQDTCSKLKSELEEEYLRDCIKNAKISPEEKTIRENSFKDIYYGDRINTNRFDFIKDGYEVK